ncbi:hypothetical protein SAMN05216389_10978 [Oceanobacillus limi]|uniref:Membrane domain of glycerophosphoryl diester phosphodiesterase n=1 Tax=Oceanobacillus limi TaxID=930131 RepID=A0A1I0DRJ6_9BACI|nr:hypothetical protein [Oceanobacillus limi]SET34380.1 hypothetical protein SAMN05216389_10978 [Oceanobacillus limi]
MEKPFKYTWEIFTGRFEKVFLLMLVTTLPLLLIHSFATNYIYAITPRYLPNHSAADIYYGLLTILLFLYAQVPYIRFVHNEHEGHEHSLKNSVYFFFANGFSIFLFACILSVLTTIGFMLFLLPGIILLAIFFPVPYISTFDGKSVWKSVKEGTRLGKKKIIKIIFILFITGFIEIFIGLFVTFQLLNITNSLAAQIITQIVLNLLIFPFVIMLITSYMIKWRESLEVLEFEKMEELHNEFAK